MCSATLGRRNFREVELRAEILPLELGGGGVIVMVVGVEIGTTGDCEGDCFETKDSSACFLSFSSGFRC